MSNHQSTNHAKSMLYLSILLFVIGLGCLVAVLINGHFTLVNIFITLFALALLADGLRKAIKYYRRND